MISRALWGVLLLMSACHNQAPQSGDEATTKRAAEAAQGPAERRFGAALQVEGEPVEVASIMADPEPYLRRTVKCRGTVSRVCQAAGCWLELRAANGGEGSEGLRVPMANHAFFVPQDIIGKVAVVEGKLGARELLEAERAHLTGEGLKATGPLFLEATGLVVR